MSRDKLKALLDSLETEINKFTQTAEKTRNSALELSKAAASSPSMSDDREHAQQQADINNRHKQKLQTLYDKISQDADLNIPTKISPNCYVQIKTNQNKTLSLYLINQLIHLPNHLLITPESPIGSELLYKSLNQTIEYQINGQTITGKIIYIE